MGLRVIVTKGGCEGGGGEGGEGGEKLEGEGEESGHITEQCTLDTSLVNKQP